MSATAALLVELLTEELPPKSLERLSNAFAAGIEKGLRARGLLDTTSVATPLATPRRLAVHLTDVADVARDQPFRQRLVPVSVGQDAQGRATPALKKKLAALGVDVVELTELVRESDGKQEVFVYAGVRAGLALAAALQAALDETLGTLPIAKMMSYQLADGVTTVQFVRPAHRLVALHGVNIVPLQALGLASGRETLGHRFHSHGPIGIDSAASYVRQLHDEGNVIASFDARRREIIAQLDRKAQSLGGNLTIERPDELIDEVTALVEWPVAYVSQFDKAFLDVPAECLVLTMQQNQKYFVLRGPLGALDHRFLLISNIETTEPAAIIGGNARVVRARLADAKFFYEQDLKLPLDERVPGLASVVYHNKLGSQLERVERITEIAVAIAQDLHASAWWQNSGGGGIDVAHVERAAHLAKADLRTLMVGEFPELQGIMGRYYALRADPSAHGSTPTMPSSSDQQIAFAIEEHYRPRFAGDGLPSSVVGVCVALADKLEALAGLFAIGEKPTGDKDPFGLRRHAIGVLRILIEKQLPLPLASLLDTAHRAFADLPGVPAAGAASSELTAFLFDRLRGMLRDDPKAYSTNEIEAVVAQQPQRIDLVPSRLAAVRAFAQLPQAASLASANKRIGNILKKADAVPSAFDVALLFEPAEQALATTLRELAPGAEAHYAANRFTEMLQGLVPLKLPVDRFFDDVMVNVDDRRLRDNRLALLAQLHALMNRVAELSVLSAT